MAEIEIMTKRNEKNITDKFLLEINFDYRKKCV